MTGKPDRSKFSTSSINSLGRWHECYDKVKSLSNRAESVSILAEFFGEHVQRVDACASLFVQIGQQGLSGTLIHCRHEARHKAVLEQPSPQGLLLRIRGKSPEAGVCLGQLVEVWMPRVIELTDERKACLSHIRHAFMLAEWCLSLLEAKGGHPRSGG